MYLKTVYLNNRILHTANKNHCLCSKTYYSFPFIFFFLLDIYHSIICDFSFFSLTNFYSNWMNLQASLIVYLFCNCLKRILKTSPDKISKNKTDSYFIQTKDYMKSKTMTTIRQPTTIGCKENNWNDWRKRKIIINKCMIATYVYLLFVSSLSARM